MSAKAGENERASERVSRTRRMAREASLSLSSSTTTASWSSSSASRNSAVALVVGGTGTSGCEVAAELVRRSRQEKQAQEGSRGRLADLGKVAVLSRNVRKEDVVTRKDVDDVEVLAVRANLQERRSIAEALREADATQVKHVFWFVEASRAQGMTDPILVRMQLATMARLQILVRLGLAMLPSMASTWYFGYLAQRAGSGPGGGTIGWMENLLGALVDVGASVESFVLCTGGKHYGMHLGPGVWPGYATPFCEDVHRCPGPLSYFEQEDFLKKRALKDDFSLTVLRPSFIVGAPAALTSSTMSLALVLGMYTSILKYQGKRLVFPGSQDCWTARLQLVTSKKIAEVAVWAASREKCQSLMVESEEEDGVVEAYNLVSCPPFTWRACWDSLAASLKMDACGPTSLFGCTALSVLGGTEEARGAWRDLSLKHNLRQDVDLWGVFEAGFLDKALTCGWDCEFSSRKLAAAGFPRDRVLESLDAACILRSAFADLCAARILPSFSDI